MIKTYSAQNYLKGANRNDVKVNFDERTRIHLFNGEYMSCWQSHYIV